MNWKIKAIIQKILASLPHGDKLNHLPVKQQKKYHENVFKYQFLECVRKLNLTQLDLNNKKLKALEIGTGFSIISPITLSLLGFNEIVTVDITEDINFNDFKKQIRFIYLPEIMSILIEKSTYSLDELNFKIETIEHSNNFEDLFKLCNISYIPNYKLPDIDSLGITFDYIFSQVVLEHISPENLHLLFSNFKTWLAPTGISVHTINFIDHFANPGFFQDKNISEFNFLRYSENYWEFWSGNSIAYTNRLCHQYYLELCQQLNYRTVLFNGENYRPHKHLEERKIHNDITSKYLSKINLSDLQKFQRGTLIIKN
jgi:hypothetical protein